MTEMQKAHQNLLVKVGQEYQYSTSLASTLRLQFFVRECHVMFLSCMPNFGSLISIASCVGSGPVVDELKHTFLVPKLLDVVRDEPVRPS